MQEFARYAAAMDIRSIWIALTQWIGAVSRYELLAIALAAMVLSWIASSMVRRRMPAGRMIGAGSTVVLVGVLITVVLQLSRFDPRIELAVPELGLPQQSVEGGETRVPLADDGHYWLRAEVNGVSAAFLVDTGATLTAVNADLAAKAGLKARRGGIPIELQTANGAVAAQLSTIDELRFGNVAARGTDAVIAQNLGDTNVIGMNVLSRLKSWRVEDGTLVLVPNNPQPELKIES